MDQTKSAHENAPKTTVEEVQRFNKKHGVIQPLDKSNESDPVQPLDEMIDHQLTEREKDQLAQRLERDRAQFSQERAPFSREFEQAVLDRIQDERDVTQSVRENYAAMLLTVASRILPGVATAWAGAPEMVVRHAVDIAQMLLAAVDAKVDEKYPPVEQIHDTAAAAD